MAYDDRERPHERGPLGGRRGRFHPANARKKTSCAFGTFRQGNCAGSICWESIGNCTLRSVLVRGKQGYACHPETLRWRGKLKALYRRHKALVSEMRARGYRHRSPLPKRLATGRTRQASFVDSLDVQVRMLKRKRCRCEV